MKFILVAAMMLCTSPCWAQAAAATGLARHTTTSAADTEAASIDSHITALHDELKITPAEEPQWAKVADAMRANAQNIDALLEKRHNDANTETAVDNLRSWNELAQAHADGSKALLDAFAPLYADMPDAQKKIADDAFRPAQSNAKSHAK